MTDLDILACRPVKWEGFPYSLLPETPIYPGSIQEKCQECGNDIWIGPNQQTFIENNPLIVMCFVCAAKTSTGHDLEVVSLGNDYEPEEP